VADKNGLRLTDGQIDFSLGVNSGVIRTKATPFTPHGVKQNQLSWMSNSTVRGGGIGQRPAFHALIQQAVWSGTFMGGFLYQPDVGDPILILVIDGRIYRVRVDTDNSVTDLSALYGLTLPITSQAYFAQAEMFLVIQNGDLITKPLFYDFGVEGLRPETLRQSLGFVGVNDPTNEIPPAGPMDYYAQRLWYAFGRNYAAGDIVLNHTSGTAGTQFQYRDSVLAVTENPVASGGDAFVVPTNAGNIRALKHAANIDTALGESQLFVYTRRAVYTCVAPITRADWTATTLDAMPLQKVALVKGGTYAERSVLAVNGDLFFQSPPNGDIRSIAVAVRNFRQWGNVPLSSNETRVISFNDRALLQFASGIEFDNRLLQTALPVATPAGAGFRAIIPLDFDVISTFEEQLPPAWEGVYDLGGGPYVLQLLEGDFGGRERAFAVAWSLKNSAIEIWELRPDQRFDQGDARVTRVLEFPAYPFGDPFGLKELDTAELWFDKMLGTVNVEVFYRPDSFSCWLKWHAFQLCAAKDCREDPDDPCPDNGYPKEAWCEQDAIPITLPKPVSQCIDSKGRPSTWGYQFQVKLVIKGWCRVRGLLLHALWREKAPYEGIRCALPEPRL